MGSCRRQVCYHCTRASTLASCPCLHLLLLFPPLLADSGSGAPLTHIQCGTPFYGLRSVVAVLPAWWRFAQCLRRYRDCWKIEKENKKKQSRNQHLIEDEENSEQNDYRYQHLINAGKYSTTFFVVLFSSLASVWRGELGLLSACYQLITSPCRPLNR